MKLILLFAIVGVIAFVVYMFVFKESKEKASDDNVSDTEEVIFYPGYDKNSVLPVTLEQSGKREETIDTIIVNDNDNSNLLTFIWDFTLPDSTFYDSIFLIEKAVGTSPNNYVRIQKYEQVFTFDYFKDGSALFSIRSNHNNGPSFWGLWADDTYNSSIAALTGHLRMEIVIPQTYENDAPIDVNITHVDTNTTYKYAQEAPDKKVILYQLPHSPSHDLNYTLDEVPYTIKIETHTIEVHEVKIIT